MNNPVLTAKQLAKVYLDGVAKIEVLKNISLTVNPSEMVAIVGTSGSGKSTLLHLLGGLDKPSDGHVFLNGKDLNKLSELKRCRLRNHYLGFVYQFHHLLPEFTAIENVGMPLLIRGRGAKEIHDKSAQLLQKVGLEKRLHHRVSELSGGERQRVAIARALVSNPLCVLADEPTGNLDPYNAEKVLQLFIDLQKQQQTSIILVTHDVNIAKQCQRKLKIVDGSLVNIE